MQRAAAERSARWLLFSNLHFKHKDLDRIRLTAQWIVAQAEQHHVQRVIVCGDLLTSRTMQPTHVLSACYRFISDLSDVVPHINIVLGNHDLAYRRDYRTTALDALGMRRLSPFVSLHSGIERDVWDGHRVLLLPFREEQEELTAAVDALDPAEAMETLAFAHLAINKAITQRHIVPSPSRKTPRPPSTIRYRGLTGPGRFASLARTFTGHFHSHQVLRQEPPEGSAAHTDPLQGSVMYLGSPLQLTWADLRDEQRGVVLCDPSTLACEMLVNPHAIGYTTIDVNDVLDGTVDVAAIAEKHVMLLGELTRFKYATARDQLLSLGVRSVRNWSPMGPVIQAGHRASGAFGASVPSSDAAVQELEQPAEDSVERDTKSNISVPLETEIGPTPHRLDLGAEAQNYVKTLSLDSSLEPRRKELIQAGQRVIQASSTFTNEDSEAEIHYHDFFGENPGPVTSQGSATLARASSDVFVAKPQSLTIKNFLGVQGVLTIDFKRGLPRGLVFLVGDNGSGKSTIVEAMVWCQFGRCIRSGLAANDVINDTAGKDCSVSLAFSNGYTITRHRKDKTYKNRIIVSLNGEPQTQMEHPDARTTQAAIDELLGIDYETYVRSVVLGHESAASFLNSTLTQRRDLIEQSLGLSTLTRCGQMSRLILKDLDLEVTEIQKRIAGVERVMESNEREQRDLKKSQKRLTLEAERVAVTLDAAAQQHSSAQQETVEQGPTPAQNLAEVDKRIAFIRQNMKPLLEQNDSAEICIAFHAEISSSQRRLWLEQGRLERLRIEYNRLINQEAAKPTTWWDRAQQRCLRELELVSTAQPVGLPKIICLATILAIRTQLSALKVWARMARFFKMDKDKNLKDLEAAIVTVGLDMKNITQLVSQLQFDTEAAAVIARVAANRGMDSKEAERVVSAMPLETAKTIKEQLGHAVREHWTLQQERNSHLDEARLLARRVERARISGEKQAGEQENLQHKLAAKRGEAAIYERLAEGKRASVTSLRCEHEDLGADLVRLAATRELFAFWASAFAKRTRRISTAESTKAIATFREYVLNQSLAELNTLLPQVLTVLYDDTRHARAMTTGILRALFESDDGGGPLDTVDTATPVLDNTLAVHPSLAYGKRSSGERKRMDLAVFFALLQVRHARSSHRAHYVLVDEVFDSLDEAGQAAVVRWCAFAARRVAGWIVVITHSRVLIDQANRYHKEADDGYDLGSVVTIRAHMKENGMELCFNKD
ncbi:hypothetical protein RB593_010034 [Gaeumannomyces tritici]